VRKKKPRIGRPPVPRKLAKASLLSVRFSGEEKRTLDRAAKISGEKLSEWSRRILLAAAELEPISPGPDTQREWLYDQP
jgi:hypothetical protein